MRSKPEYKINDPNDRLVSAYKLQVESQVNELIEHRMAQLELLMLAHLVQTGDAPCDLELVEERRGDEVVWTIRRQGTGIYINGYPIAETRKSLTYDEVCFPAGAKEPNLTVTWKSGSDHGILSRGQSIGVHPDLRITAMHTGAA